MDIYGRTVFSNVPVKPTATKVFFIPCIIKGVFDRFINYSPDIRTTFFLK